MAIYFLEKYILFSVLASRYHMWMMAAGFVVHPGPRLAHDFVGESGVQNPTVCAMPKRSLHPPHDRLVRGMQKLLFQITIPEWGRGTHRVDSWLQCRDFDVGFGSASKVRRILIARWISVLVCSRGWSSSGAHNYLFFCGIGSTQGQPTLKWKHTYPWIAMHPFCRAFHWWANSGTYFVVFHALARCVILHHKRVTK